MNATETARLCMMISSLCPGQRMDEETPAVWAVVLEDLSLRDALEALKIVARRQVFIAPSDLISEGRKIRAARGSGLLPTPNVDPENGPAYRAELRALAQADADGALDVADYERGGRTLTGAAPLRALDAVRVAVPAQFQRMIETTTRRIV